MNRGTLWSKGIMLGILAASVATAACAEELRVMSFNLRHGKGKDGDNSWEFRKGTLVGAIKASNPDIMGVQECLDFQAEYLACEFPQYKWIGRGREKDGSGEMSAIFYRADKLNALDQGHFWISETPDVPGSRSWGTSCTRMATWVRLESKEGVKFLHINTHLDHVSEEARVQGAQLLARQMPILSQGAPAILTGDFNAGGGTSEAWKVLTEKCGLVDAWDVAAERKGPAKTFGSFKAPTDEPGDRIDWIMLLGKITSRSCETVLYNENGRYPSDHYPVSAVLDLVQSVKPAAVSREVRYEFLRPAQVDAAMKECPVLFVPLGTIEWHGLHNVTGLDAVKAHALCVQAAQQGGGVVMPALFGGVGGIAEPHTFIMDPEDSLKSDLLRPWLEQLCREAVRNGWKAVIVVTGHYGAAQQIAVRETAVRMSKELNRPILGTPEYFLALDEGYIGDHAAFFETSLMMHLFPDTVKLDELGDEPHKGVGGRDPVKFANAADGKRLCDAIVKRLALLASEMPKWDTKKVRRFVRAEEALVNRQLEMAGESGSTWKAWQRIPDGYLKEYPELLVSGRFEGITKLVKGL
jgi:creatinine amidohydrolase